MARIRSVKPEFFSSEPVGNCSPTSRLLFVALWCMADDDGRLVDNPRVIRAFAFPLDDGITSVDIDAWIDELHVAQLVMRYEVDGRKYLCVRNFKEHQHPKKPQASKLPAPPVGHQFPTSSPPVPPPFPTGTPRRGGEGRGEEGSIPPSAGGVAAPRAASPTGDGPDGADERPALTLALAGGATATSHGQRPAARAQRPATPRSAPKWPHFPAETRTAVYEAWTGKLGAVDYGQLVHHVAPLFRPPDDPAYVPHDALVRGVRDYASLISTGRSAPFASPADCAKRLVALARNAIACASDPVARADGASLIIHGRVA